MKNKSQKTNSWFAGVSLPAAIVLMLSMGGGLVDAADFSGHDNFDDNVEDLSLWVVNRNTALGRVTETNGHLYYYTAPGIPSDDSSGWGYRMALPATNDWELRLTVHVPPLAVQSNQYCSFSLKILNRNNFNDWLAFSLGQTGPPGTRTFNLAIATNGAMSFSGIVETTAEAALLSLRWNAASHQITARSSTDEGKTWIECGPPVDNPWNIWPNGSFGTGPGAHSIGMTISVNDQLYGDDFWLASGKPIIQPFTGNGVLAWTDNLTNAYYTIEWAPRISGPWYRGWTNQAFIRNTSTNTSVEVPMFFRVVRE